MSLALAGAADRDEANSFLRKQGRLADLQMEEMQAEEPYKLSHYRLRRFSDWAKAAFELSIGLIALALVGGLGAMVWKAAHSEGLVVESFSVPPDLAARGLSGQVVAGQLLDELSAMQAATVSNRPAKSYGNNWEGDIKVEIPQTGISIGEFQRYLREWLGHESHIGGAVYRTASDIVVAARTSSGERVKFSGPEAELESLIRKTAERIYALSQPYRYSIYLGNVLGDIPAAMALRRQMTQSPDPQERKWAWIGLANNYASVLGNFQAAIDATYRALEIDPGFAIALTNRRNIEANLGHAEAALTAARAEAALLRQGRADSEYNYAAQMRLFNGQLTALALGDFAQAVPAGREGATLPGQQQLNLQTGVLIALASQHDGDAMRAQLRALPVLTASDKVFAMSRAIAIVQAQAASRNWPATLAMAAAVQDACLRLGVTTCDSWPAVRAQVTPFMALARARSGDIAGAERLIAATPGDCYDSVRVRGLVASEARQWGRADYWFARAVADAPSIPFAHEDWGRSLLARGKADGAIAQFTLSNRKGPHFADALEGWGEALMAKNQSHLALAKFAEAEKYAPNWGRLHLKWGQALFHAGRKDEAAKQFARAARLDLTPSEKAELAWHAVATNP